MNQHVGIQQVIQEPGPEGQANFTEGPRQHCAKHWRLLFTKDAIELVD